MSLRPFNPKYTSLFCIMIILSFKFIEFLFVISVRSYDL